MCDTRTADTRRPAHPSRADPPRHLRVPGRPQRDIGRSTWIAVEAGTRDTEEHTLGRVERVLGWAHGTIGSIADVITPNGSVADTAPADDDWVARLIAIRDSPRRSPALRTMAAAQLTQLEALLAAADAEDAQRVSGDRAG